MRKVEVLVLGDVLEHFGLHDVDPHAHWSGDLRLLLEVANSLHDVEVEDPVVDLDRPRARRDREHVAVLLVVADQVAVVELRQHVAVHHEESAVEAVDELERRSGAERFVLVHVLDRDVPVLTVVEDRLDEMREVADAERDVLDPTGLELVDHELEDRPLADRHQRLRKHRGVRREARAAAAREHDGLRLPVTARPGAVAVRRSSTGHCYRLSTRWRTTAGCKLPTGWVRVRRRRMLSLPVSRWTATSRRNRTAATVQKRIRPSISNERRRA